MPMTKAYARALVARNAEKLREAVNALMAYETDTLMHHNLASISCECAWCEREYGEEVNG